MCVLGTLLPLAAVWPWLSQQGLSIYPRFLPLSTVFAGPETLHLAATLVANASHYVLRAYHKSHGFSHNS
ncbi:hypothetical protein GCM10009092_02810 [Bowmanella denitrificans]|uniref:Secreted protein n=1 Tax=Bowmanella denitrificans TaxID=366582 RepID=A0ABN0WMR5_9ALTE